MGPLHFFWWVGGQLRAQCAGQGSAKTIKPPGRGERLSFESRRQQSTARCHRWRWRRRRRLARRSPRRIILQGQASLTARQVAMFYVHAIYSVTLRPAPPGQRSPQEAATLRMRARVFRRVSGKTGCRGIQGRPQRCWSRVSVAGRWGVRVGGGQAGTPQLINPRTRSRRRERRSTPTATAQTNLGQVQRRQVLAFDDGGDAGVADARIVRQAQVLERGGEAGQVTDPAIAHVPTTDFQAAQLWKLAAHA